MHATIQPKGSLSLALDGAARLVAASETFQEAVGLDRHELQKQRVFFGEINGDADGLGHLRPFALIIPDTNGYVRIGQSMAIELGASGGILVVFVASAAPIANHNDNLLTFTNFVGQVVDEMADLTGDSYDHGQKAYWWFEKIDPATAPARTPVDRRDTEDVWVASYLLRYEA